MLERHGLAYMSMNTRGHESGIDRPGRDLAINGEHEGNTNLDFFRKVHVPCEAKNFLLFATDRES